MPTPDDHSATHQRPDVVEFLEPGQLVGNRCTPVPRAELGRRAQAGLWLLRITVLLLVAMVGYTFFTQVWP
ncbi:MAG: hypothetical protein ACLPYO_10370 [Mycobacterium sp.]